jgi:4,5-DOPA dioxygenase extradiol
LERIVSIPLNTSLGSVVYISHGGGPLPLLGDKSHVDMIKALQVIAGIIEKPSAIVVISAHWEEEKPTITSGERPSLIYDYYGFPSESYEIQYLAVGNPALAHKIFDLLKSNRIEATLTDKRGFDHGLFVPLKLMYPDATIPCVQLSLLKSLDPLAHIQMGKALAELRKDNVLVIGSGFSFHNLKAFFSPSTAETQAMNEAFEQWLMDTFSDSELSEQERLQRLVNWEDAPAARYCHPREEHLLPLHVCYGMVESKANQVFTFEVLGKKASCYLW